MRSSPAPSSAMHAAGAASSRANRCFTPRRSPIPSSPTVAAKMTGRCVRTRAPSIASASASMAASPRELSTIPGPASWTPSRATPTGVPSGKTVSRCAHTSTGAPSLVPRRAADHVSDVVGANVLEPERAEARRDTFTAGLLGAGRRRNLRERRSACRRPDRRRPRAARAPARDARTGRPSWRKRSRRGRSCAIYRLLPAQGARCRRDARDGCASPMSGLGRPSRHFFHVRLPIGPKLGRNVFALARSAF